MKKRTLLARLITIVISSGMAFSSMQIPLCVIAAETAIEEESAEEELTSEPETVASETSAPEKEIVEDEPITEETVATDTEKPDSDAKDKSSDESVEKPVENNETPKEEVTPEVTSEGKETPAEGPDKDHDANADDSKDGTEDEIIEEETESVTTREAVYSRATYNDVFATLKGSGYSLSQARNAVSTTFTVGQYMYIWAWLHDANGNLYKSYGSGTPNMMLAIYRPDGSCAHSYTYNNSDNNWIGVRLDKAGTWKIQSKISGALTGNNIQTVTVKDDSRATYNDVFATLKGSGYSLSQARNAVSTTFTVGQYMYIWAWLHDANGNLYKSYGSGTPNMMLAIYRPDGSCAHSYTYNNSDNNWIGVKLDKAGTWKIQSKISGALTGNTIQTVTVKQASGSTNIVPTSVKIGNASNTMYVGDSKTLSATVSPSNATNKGVTWKSSNTSVLTVNSNGTITAKSAGSAKITVTTKVNGKSTSITVTVKSKGGASVYNKAKSFLGKKYTYFSGNGFHYRAWCADFVSYCAKLAGQSKAIPKNASVSGIRTAIKNAGGKEYSKAKVKNGSYVPKRGDIIIFKSNGASHVGIVDYASNGYIYYIDGNNTTNGNGNASCVHYSKCSYGYSKLTCVLKPNY